MICVLCDGQGPVPVVPLGAVSVVPDGLYAVAQGRQSLRDNVRGVFATQISKQYCTGSPSVAVGPL